MAAVADSIESIVLNDFKVMKNDVWNPGEWITVRERPDGHHGGPMGFGTRYRNPIVLHKYVDISNPRHRWYVANNDKIGKFLTKNYLKRATSKPFGFFDGFGLEAQTITENDEILAQLQQMNFISWFLDAGMRQMVHGWQMSIPETISSEDEDKEIKIEEITDFKVFGEHESHQQTEYAFRRANSGDVSARKFQIDNGEDLPPIKINQILHVRGTWIPEAPLWRTEVLQMESVDVDASKIFHTANGSWNYGYGDSVFEAVWDSIIKLAEQSENDHFRQGVWAFAILNPDLQNDKTETNKWVQKALYALNHKQLFADFPYLHPETGVPIPGVPSLNFRNIVQDGDPSKSRASGLFTDMSSEWANLTLETGYTIRRLTGHPGGALAAADVDATADLVNDIDRFVPLIHYLIRPFLKLLQSFGLFQSVDFDKVIIKTHWQIELEKRLLVEFGEVEEARKTTSEEGESKKKETEESKETAKKRRTKEEEEKKNKRCPKGFEKNLDTGKCEKKITNKMILSEPLLIKYRKLKKKLEEEKDEKKLLDIKMQLSSLDEKIDELSKSKDIQFEMYKDFTHKINKRDEEFLVENYDYIETKSVKIDDIKMVKPVQIEEESVQFFIEKLKEARDLDGLDPIKITDNYELLDGNHRLTAYKRLMHYWIKAKIYKKKLLGAGITTEDEAIPLEGSENYIEPLTSSRMNELGIENDYEPEILEYVLERFNEEVLNSKSRQEWIEHCIDKHGPSGDKTMKPDQCVAAGYEKFKTNMILEETYKLNGYMISEGADVYHLSIQEEEYLRQNFSFPVVPVASSTVKGVGLKDDKLVVQFHKSKGATGSGSTYVYKFEGDDAKSLDYFDRMTKSTSKGGFVWDELRGKEKGPAWGTGKQTPGGTSASIIPYEKAGRSPIRKLGGFDKFEAEAKELQKFKMEPVPGFTGVGAPDVLAAKALGTKRAFSPEQVPDPEFYTVKKLFGQPRVGLVTPSEFKGTPKKTGKPGRPPKGETGFQAQKRTFEEGTEKLFQLEVSEGIAKAQKQTQQAGTTEALPKLSIPTPPEEPKEETPEPTDEERASAFGTLQDLFKKRKKNASEMEMQFGIVPNSKDGVYGKQLDMNFKDLKNKANQFLMHDIKYFFNGVNKAAKLLHKGNNTVYREMRSSKSVIRYNKIKSKEMITKDHPKFGKLLRDDPDNWYVICNGFSRTNPFNYVVNGRVVTEFQCEKDIKNQVGLTVPLGIYHDLEKDGVGLPDWQIVGSFSVLEYDPDTGTEISMRKTNKEAVKNFFKRLGANDWITPMYEKAMEDIKNGKTPKLPNISTAYPAEIEIEKKHNVRLQKNFKLVTVSYVPRGNCSEPYCTADLVRINSAKRSCILEKISEASAMLDEEGIKYNMEELIRKAVELCRSK